MIVQNLNKLASPKEIAAYARDNEMINLAENFSEKQCAKELESLLQQYIIPYANRPAQKFGMVELRKAISEKTERYYDYTYNPETEISILTGVKQTVFATILALLKEGDEVLIFEPAHRSYVSAINITGARPVFVELKTPDFHVDWEDVQKLITSRTRMIIINSPHFPTGATLSELDMIRLQKIINGTNILILSDESFEHVVFDKEMHQSIALYPKLRERSVIVSSFNESFNISNWYIGYCMSTEKIMSQIRKVISIIGEGIATPFQMALTEYMKNDINYNQFALEYQHKRDLFCNALDDSNIQVTPSKGTYFQLISRKGKSDENDIDLGIKLMQDFNLATIPISYYYHQKMNTRFLRLNLSLPDDILNDVAKRLRTI